QVKIRSLNKLIDKKDLEKFTRKLYIHRQKDRPKDEGGNGMKTKMTKVSKKDFEAYARIQRSGAIDMTNITLVSKLSGLSKDKIRNIRDRYREVSRRFKFIRD
ncbi:unnamed protein product, partial [marine sediment metagenome]